MFFYYSVQVPCFFFSMGNVDPIYAVQGSLVSIFWFFVLITILEYITVLLMSRIDRSKQTGSFI